MKMLSEESSEPPKVVKAWLAKQAPWPKPRKIDHAHFYVTKVNKIHQADLLYLPHDKLYGNTYKYVLNVIDIASGYKASRLLKTKKASEVVEMFKDIYKKGPLLEAYERAQRDCEERRHKVPPQICRLCWEF